MITTQTSITDNADNFMNGKIDEDTEENIKIQIQEQYLDLTRGVGIKLLEVYNKISDTEKKNIEAIDIKKELDDFEKWLDPDTDTVSKNIKKIEVQYEFDISDFAPKKLVFEAPDMSPEALEKRFVSRLTTKQKLIYHLQINLRLASRKRDKIFSIDSDFLTDELKFEIKLAKDALKSRTESIRNLGKDNINFIQLIMDCINTRKVSIINYILDYDVEGTVKPLRNHLMIELKKINEESEPVTDGFTSYSSSIGKSQKTQDLRENYKKI